jgi:predicted RecA/RadA family phage recombinase
MTTKLVQEGNVIDYIAGGAIAAGAVVALSHNIGIALVAAAASGDVIAVAVEGCFTVPKVSGAVWVAGEKLIWDTSAGAFDDSAATPAAGDITGAVMAVNAGLNGETTATVKLTPGNNTLT